MPANRHIFKELMKKAIICWLLMSNRVNYFDKSCHLPPVSMSIHDGIANSVTEPSQGFGIFRSATPSIIGVPLTARVEEAIAAAAGYASG